MISLNYRHVNESCWHLYKDAFIIAHAKALISRVDVAATNVLSW
ncbi:hypothetical protein PSM_A0628 [Pseudoalteromonas sp. SM9913]|nr:hypothetical protein PSM_A0628 [Pseudoalteromonas sp. SM9913]